MIELADAPLSVTPSPDSSTLEKAAAPPEASSVSCIRRSREALSLDTTPEPKRSGDSAPDYVIVGADYGLMTTGYPDGTLGIATVKLKLGEFAFQPTNSSAIMVDPKWSNKYIVWKHTFSAVPLRNNCHEQVIEAVEGALAEVVAKGLKSSIDVAITNRYGGCFVGRYNRLAGLFGAPSRHAFGMAIDMNTTTNQQWATPHMNCDVVRIFRKWGFAWGGNFWPSDGMHFEWVGERRDQWGYPSRYCPNKVPVPATTVPSATTSITTTTTTTTPATSTTTTTTTVPMTSTT